MDAGGNLYVRDATVAQWHKVGPNKKQRFAGVIRRYSPGGQIAYRHYCRLVSAGGSAAMDSRGNFYVVELPECRWGQVVHDFGGSLYQRTWEPDHDPKRAGRTVRMQSELSHLVKMAAAGGERDSEAELWAHRGVSAMNAGGCMCEWPDQMVAVDGADRIFAVNADISVVKVLDAAGNMIARIGRWGSAETLPGADGDARELGFHFIYCVAAAGDRCYVGDKHLRRIAKVGMAYRETRAVALRGPGGSDE
jgi:hypothetical protein